MGSELAIEVKDVSMTFNMSEERIDNLKEHILKLIKGQLFYQEFNALKNISFNIKKGEVFGLVGLNGAGKSTLLKIIAGVLKPTSGTVAVNGTIAPLIELSAGFNLDLTGRENIYLNGAVFGHSNKFMSECFDRIVNFSELHEFIDVPLKNYSSGMLARLAFSIATIVDPDILIVDEVLSVGDFRFQEKCEAYISSLINKGTTVLFVSHSMEQVEKLCQRALLLNKGELVLVDEISKVVETYKNIS
ncbi:ABC transporter ATP-binding protein [Paenibacillus sp. AK121]|uniref:ABC transporter ATP-binding protein n=1 Tax=Paenibacillus TaxID=44249 RepID=UPI000FA5AAED|nr:ABC transporter ATP-binding protein [Paenibacillus sp. AK121]MBU9706512.1 ABC transporter ATP-binding protein [Paenibacillus sp. AK121]MEE4570974.1 ABC transporter ATP-binding protein [Paenibacillus polymyxa]